MKLCVFPNDPIIYYYKKGEIKERYYNPCDIFDEIHIISPIEDDVEESKVKAIAGKADLKIHCVGKISLLNRFTRKNKIMNLVSEIKPDIIRAYNPLLQGWAAAYSSQKLGIPFFLSLHVQYDGLRRLVRTKNYKKYLALKYTEKFIEPYVLAKADKITAVYSTIIPYVLKYCDKEPEILYNKIDLEKIQKGRKVQNFDRPLILSVGRLTQQKNHDILIKAIRGLEVYLEIIGDGELFESLNELVRNLNLSDRIFFIKSIPNEKIYDYYKSADVFALAYDPEVEGVPIPVLEAMGAGLPILIPRPIGKYSDNLEAYVAFADLNVEAFHSKLKRIIVDKDYAKNLRDMALKKCVSFDSKIIEKRESEIYHELLEYNKRI